MRTGKSKEDTGEKGLLLGALGIPTRIAGGPRDSQKGLIGTLGIPKKGLRGTLGIPIGIPKRVLPWQVLRTLRPGLPASLLYSSKPS